MSSLAEVLLDMGYPVTGSDLKFSPTTERLAARGAVVYEGHTAANLAGAKMVVYSSAVRPENPEIVEARRRKLPVIPRGELLAELMRIKAEGDYEAIKALIDKYGVRFDPALRDQVVARFQKLDLPTYWAGINADLTASLDANGNVSEVHISYPRDYVKQQLGYSALYTQHVQ